LGCQWAQICRPDFELWSPGCILFEGIVAAPTLTAGGRVETQSQRLAACAAREELEHERAPQRPFGLRVIDRDGFGDSKGVAAKKSQALLDVRDQGLHSFASVCNGPAG